MNAEDDRISYEKPTLFCLIPEPGIMKGGGSEDADEEVMGRDVEQPTPEPLENEDPLA